MSNPTARSRLPRFQRIAAIGLFTSATTIAAFAVLAIIVLSESPAPHPPTSNAVWLRIVPTEQAPEQLSVLVLTDRGFAPLLYWSTYLQITQLKPHALTRDFLTTSNKPLLANISPEGARLLLLMRFPQYGFKQYELSVTPRRGPFSQFPDCEIRLPSIGSTVDASLDSLFAAEILIDTDAELEPQTVDILTSCSPTQRRAFLARYFARVALRYLDNTTSAGDMLLKTTRTLANLEEQATSKNERALLRETRGSLEIIGHSYSMSPTWTHLRIIASTALLGLNMFYSRAS